MPGDPRDEIERHLPALRAFALSLAHDATLADDIVQDTVIKAWINFGSFEPGTNLKAWLFTILRNTFYSELRKRRPDFVSLDNLMAREVAMRPDQEGVLVLRDFMSAFRTLSYQQREALLLIGTLGFSYEEAAEMCGVPTGTVKSRVYRARNTLAARLQVDAATPGDPDESERRGVDRANGPSDLSQGGKAAPAGGGSLPVVGSTTAPAKKT